ncbi:MAG: hypothetical protein NTZ85_01670 [Bacteroidia bacterium]|nr:hypothetical protein [Bacteroidia bacterium]
MRKFLNGKITGKITGDCDVYEIVIGEELLKESDIKEGEIVDFVLYGDKYESIVFKGDGREIRIYGRYKSLIGSEIEIFSYSYREDFCGADFNIVKQ